MKIVLNGILLRYSDLRAVPSFQTLLTTILTHCLTTLETNYLNRRVRLADGHPPFVECHTLALSTQTSDANIKTNSLNHNRGSLRTRFFVWRRSIIRSFELIGVAQAVHDASDLYSESILREFRLLPRSEDCAILGYYTASSGNFFTEVSGQPISLIFRVQESLVYHYSLRNKTEVDSSQKVSFPNFARNTDNPPIVAVLLIHSKRTEE